MSKSAKGMTPFVEGKIRLWYRFHNLKRNGFMSKKEFSDLADGFISEYNLDEQTSKAIRNWLVDGWKVMIEHAEKGGENNPMAKEKAPLTLLVAEKIANNEIITEDMYVSAYNEILNIDQELFVACFSQMVTSFFNIFDQDRDGFLCEADVVRGWKCFGIRKDEAIRSAFRALDTSGSGKVDLKTYLAAWVEYMTGTDTNAPLAKNLTVDAL